MATTSIYKKFLYFLILLKVSFIAQGIHPVYYQTPSFIKNQSILRQFHVFKLVTHLTESARIPQPSINAFIYKLQHKTCTHHGVYTRVYPFENGYIKMRTRHTPAPKTSYFSTLSTSEISAPLEHSLYTITPNYKLPTPLVVMAHPPARTVAGLPCKLPLALLHLPPSRCVLHFVLACWKRRTRWNLKADLRFLVRFSLTFVSHFRDAPLTPV